MTNTKFIIIDLFCGAGGTTTGFEMTKGLAKVIACVNHDPKAIKSHWANHPQVKHYEEDIRTLELSGLVDDAQKARETYPDAMLILWASLECTNFSKAKGGQPREADSRTLADHLDRYIHALDPDYVQIENVVEFMSWGPLDENGKPISRRNGCDWLKWKTRLCSYGYYDEWRELNSADYGAYTSRNRLFGCFAKHGLPIAWPSATHSRIRKTQNTELFATGQLKPWKPVKDVLDFEDEGNSIFGRKKPLSEKTLERIYAGLVKFVAGGKDNFLAKIYAVASNSHGTYNTESAAHTITTRDAHALIRATFISRYYGSNPEHRNYSIEEPCGVVRTNNCHSLVNATFLHAYFGNGDNNTSTERPAPTLTTKDRCVLVQAKWLDQQYGQSGPASIAYPAGTLTATPKLNVVQTVPFVMHTNYSNQPTSIDNPHPVITANRKHSYLVNPSWGGNPGGVEEPSPVIIARQDKAPMYLVQTEQGAWGIVIYDTDSPMTVQIKEFMALYGIADIKMRMLKITELKKIQGFPEGYVLEGTQADQKKAIGNSVHPIIPKVWAQAMAEIINNDNKCVA